MDPSDEPLQARQCLRCRRFPQYSISTGIMFMTHICYENCGNVFWTLKTCVHCKAENKTRVIQKPRCGELVTCSQCQFKLYFFRCPYEDCQVLIYKEYQKYIMGFPIQCDKCKRGFKLVVCPCGGQKYLQANELIIEGKSTYKCIQCEKDIVYTICSSCFMPNYHRQELQIGQRFKCSHCQTMRVYVPCPLCGRTTNSDKFYFGQTNFCNFCSKRFEFSNCPFGCGVNYYYQQALDNPFRKCAVTCNTTFLAVSCRYCLEPLYMDDYIVGVGREEECPNCQKQIKFYLCSCGLLNPCDTKCQRPQCPPPLKVVSYSKQWKEEQKKIQEAKKKEQNNEDYDEKVCKLCYTEPSVMVNVECKHMMMCQPCFNHLMARERGLNGTCKCPICKRSGKYQKYIQPKYA